MIWNLVNVLLNIACKCLKIELPHLNIMFVELLDIKVKLKKKSDLIQNFIFQNLYKRFSTGCFIS